MPDAPSNFVTVPRARRVQSLLMFAICALFAAIIIATLCVIVGYLVAIGGSSMSLSLFTEVPTGDRANPGGLKHAIVGTLGLIAMASLLGVPMGVLAGIYLSEYASGSVLGRPVRFVADVLSGVPSIVVGILGYELVVVPLTRLEWVRGYNGYAGAFALAFIMVPIVARTTEEMLRLVPQSYRAGSLALGATKAQTIMKVVLPAATGSVITGIMLAIARIAGETAPLLFTALNTRLLTLDPREPFPSLTVQIYQFATGPNEQEKRLAWAGILVLITILLVINLAVRTLAARTIRRTAGR